MPLRIPLSPRDPQRPELCAESTPSAACVLLRAFAYQSAHPGPVDIGGHDRLCLQLKTGPRAAHTSNEERQQPVVGRVANIDRPAEAGQLLTAGSYAQPKRDPDPAGVLVQATSDVAEAQALAATDPAMKAEIVRTESVRLWTRAPLDAFLEQHLAEEARAKSLGELVAATKPHRPRSMACLRQLGPPAPDRVRGGGALMATTSNSGRARRPALAGVAVDRSASSSVRGHS